MSMYYAEKIYICDINITFFYNYYLKIPINYQLNYAHGVSERTYYIS